MDSAQIDEIKAQMQYEFDRVAPPEGFPKFPDIPTGRHISDEFWDLEQEHLWPKVWVVAGKEDKIPNPGDYFVFKDLGVPLLVVRGTDGEVRCFYNTCQHRGAPVVREDEGSSRRLRCQYHSWTYEIDGGTLVSLPDERDFVDLDWEQRCLPKASCETFGGFIFVNRDLDAVPVAEWLGGAADLFLASDGPSLTEVYRTTEIVPCNWKVVSEAFLEVYHFKHIHSHGGVSALDNRGALMRLFRNGHSDMFTPFSRQNMERVGMESWDDFKELDFSPFPTIPTVPDIVSCTSLGLSWFPNTVMPLGKFGFPMIQFWPIDKATTEMSWTYYAPKDWEGDELPERWKVRKAQFDSIMDEDKWNMAPMQESMESPALTGIPINYQERRIWNVHEMMDRIIGMENIPEHLRTPSLLADYIID